LAVAPEKKTCFYLILIRRINYVTRYTIYDRIKEHIIRLLSWDRIGIQYE